VSTVPPPDAEVLIVRETLEEAISPALATRVMFEALMAHGGVPDDADAVERFVGDALLPSLEEAAGADIRERVASRLEHILGSRPEPVEDWVAFSNEEREPTVTKTLAVSGDDELVPIAILAKTQRLGRTLVIALGNELAEVSHAPSIRTLRAVVDQKKPLVVVVDGYDPCLMPPSSVAAVLKALPDETIRVVWGADEPYGRALSAGAGDTRMIALSGAEGIGPLLDVVTSRRAQT
jgi:hypothetical protein